MQSVYVTISLWSIYVLQGFCDRTDDICKFFHTSYQFKSADIILDFLAAVLISGGLPSSDVGNELYLASSGSSCRLPPSPDDRVGHTLESGGLLCGGEDTPDTCLQWSAVTGTWEESVTLEAGRDYHVSWTPDPSIGTFLMGDWYGGRTTTLIRPDGTQEPGFTLQHDTRCAPNELLLNTY